MNDVVTPEEPKPPYSEKERWKVALFAFFFGAFFFLGNIPIPIPNVTADAYHWRSALAAAIAAIQTASGIWLMNRAPRRDRFSTSTLPDLVLLGSVVFPIAYFSLMMK